ncbi:hypothetical protein DEO72_LG5g1905 [Vigna unguiculata]|uniref:Uncharacterized protein n=1 Tax=Vigna unguiculata TaxID=3917 RepID=A0A4D6LXU7_VIGUN|nr:hypothetical protein DEO72_LG5g1905 [Vigna unguiculata]
MNQIKIDVTRKVLQKLRTTECKVEDCSWSYPSSSPPLSPFLAIGETESPHPSPAVGDIERVVGTLEEEVGDDDLREKELESKLMDLGRVYALRGASFARRGNVAAALEALHEARNNILKSDILKSVVSAPLLPPPSQFLAKERCEETKDDDLRRRGLESKLIDLVRVYTLRVASFSRRGNVMTALKALGEARNNILKSMFLEKEAEDDDMRRRELMSKLMDLVKVYAIRAIAFSRRGDAMATLEALCEATKNIIKSHKRRGICIARVFSSPKGYPSIKVGVVGRMEADSEFRGKWWVSFGALLGRTLVGVVVG